MLEKRAVRILTNSDFLAHTATLFQRLKILDIYKINSFFTGKFMYFYYKQLLLLPSFICSLRAMKFIVITQEMRRRTEHIPVKPQQNNTQFFSMAQNCGIRFQKI
jgi:hypothetical protein